MKVALASDHRGFEAKKRLIPVLQRLGHEVADFGCEGSNSSDYPDFAIPAGRAVGKGECEAGVMLGGGGIGMCVAANKVPGVRAALVHDEVAARRAREHNHCNVLCLGTDLLGEDHIRNIVEIFLATGYGNGRHARRVEKLMELERSRGR